MHQPYKYYADPEENIVHDYRWPTAESVDKNDNTGKNIMEYRILAQSCGDVHKIFHTIHVVADMDKLTVAVHCDNINGVSLSRFESNTFDTITRVLHMYVETITCVKTGAYCTYLNKKYKKICNMKRKNCKLHVKLGQSISTRR